MIKGPESWRYLYAQQASPHRERLSSLGQHPSDFDDIPTVTAACAPMPRVSSPRSCSRSTSHANSIPRFAVAGSSQRKACFFTTRPPLGKNRQRPRWGILLTVRRVGRKKRVNLMRSRNGAAGPLWVMGGGPASAADPQHFQYPTTCRTAAHRR